MCVCILIGQSYVSCESANLYQEWGRRAATISSLSQISLHHEDKQWI